LKVVNYGQENSMRITRVGQVPPFFVELPLRAALPRRARRLAGLSPRDSRGKPADRPSRTREAA
jgi:hypothetical protein